MLECPVIQTEQCRTKQGFSYTYQQIRDGFAYFYPRRKVLEDGVTTMPLDIPVCVVN